MSSRFVFSGIQNESLEKEANQRLSRLMDGAPYDATCAALLQKGEGVFWASVDVYSTHGPFVARSTAQTADEAVSKALAKIAELLATWRMKRFSQRNPNWVSPLAPDMGVA